MATLSNIRLRMLGQPDFGVAGVPLDSLPFPAAVLAPSGDCIAANTAWNELHGQASASGLEWCPPSLRAELLAAIGAALERRSHQSVDYAGPSCRRISIAVCGTGALLCDMPAEAPHDLRHSEKMETVGRLVGGVAHDFANLLTLIAGYSDILLHRIDEKDPLRSEVEEIRGAANRGARLTAQLLAFTRGQAVQRRPLNLNAVLRDLDRMLHLIVGEYVDLNTRLCATLDPVMADAGQMEQVVMNLILNARDAMPAGGSIRIVTGNVRIDEEMAARHDVRPGPAVMLSISDTGHGIDSETLKHIFEPFFTTKEKGKGTGLGLSTVHRIVRESGGDIWVESEPAKGATFHICLPAVAHAADRVDVLAAARPGAAGSETLLLVEDEESVRKLLVHVLSRRGYTVLEASSGPEALDMFAARGREIGLVLTDMVMPHMSGRELGDRLKQQRPDVKVIYMSGYTDDILVRTGALGPGMSFLQKPLRPEHLATKVREALDA